MNKFLRHIPGFRSNTTWKKIIAIIYYIIALSMISEGWGTSLFMLAMPFLVFSFVDLIRHKKKNIPLKRALIAFVLSFALAITGIAITGSDTSESTLEEEKETIAEEQEEIIVEEKEGTKVKEKQELKDEKLEEKAVKVEGELKVHYLDVGQGDSILIQTKDAAMLIDTGDRGYGAGIVDYIRSQGINKLDYLILTHPHADHIGGATEIVNAFNIGKIIMPKVAHTSQTFENLLKTIQNKGMKITSPNPGDEYQLGDAKFIILAPNSPSYDNLNNYSIVNKVSFGKTSFLFTGDAEGTSENEIINKGFDVKADVLKVGHHGSDTSTTENFLKAVSPKYSIISCGKDNKYGHPDQIVLDRLNKHNIKVYRTDESGTIVITSDGENLTITENVGSIRRSTPPKVKSEQKTNQKTNITPPETDNVEEVYITNTGKKYHRSSCSSLKKSKIPISLKKAKSQGYEPCKKCNPPQ